jgi:protease I
MTGKLDGKRIAILATDGVEQVELVRPREAVEREGATTEIVSLSEGEFQAMNGDIQPADTFAADKAAKSADPAGYDALIMPGGTVNADRLRMSVRRLG